MNMTFKSWWSLNCPKKVLPYNYKKFLFMLCIYPSLQTRDDLILERSLIQNEHYNLFLGGHHLYMNLCVCVCLSVILSQVEFQRRNGRLPTQLGITRWKMVKINFGVTPPPKKKNIWGAYKNLLLKRKKIKVVQNCLKWRDNWLKMCLYFSPTTTKK